MGYNTGNTHARKGSKNRVIQLQFRVTDKERIAILRAAEKQNKTVSQYAGDLVCGAAGTGRE